MALTLGANNPSWLLSLSPPNLVAALERHIAGVGGHFAGAPLCWDVVNEAVADSGTILWTCLE